MELLQPFLHSSLSAAGCDIVSNGFHRFLSDFGAHAAMGMGPALLAMFTEVGHRPFLLVWMAIIGMDIFQTYNANFAWPVILDSVFDMLTYPLAFSVTYWVAMRPQEAAE
jgi:hypothetical protein